MASLPRPKQWYHRVLEGAVLRTIKLERVAGADVVKAIDPAFRHQASAKNPTWATFTQYCKEHEVSQFDELKQGPGWLEQMLGDDEWHPKIVKYLRNRRARTAKDVADSILTDGRTSMKRISNVPVYAGKQALANMKKVHEPSVSLMKKFIGSLPKLEYARALDVAGGDGRVAKEVLVEIFDKVDLFDRCPVALALVNAVKAVLPKLQHVEQATMQEYQFEEKYNLILMCWCSGYLDDEEFLIFLRKAQKNLVQAFKKTTRHQ